MLGTHFTLKEININNHLEKERIKKFLNSLSLRLDKDIEYTIVIEKDSEIIATGSIAGKVIKNIGVKCEFQGEGIAVHIVGELIKEQIKRNRDHLFIYTKPEMAPHFQDLGFTQIADLKKYVSLLEWGGPNIHDYLGNIKIRAEFKEKKDIGAVVVNCNPFTLGHQYLIEKAAKECEALYIIVVSEDKSLFSRETRVDLIKKGTIHLKNVQVIEGGDYVISSSTFPSYFTREEDLAKVHSLLDVEIFCRYLVPTLGIKKRYVGEEPLCKVTNIYNDIMEKELPKREVSLYKIPRKEIDGEIISASLVRKKIKNEDWEGIKKLVPETTYDFLRSSRAKAIIEKIKYSCSRH